MKARRLEILGILMISVSTLVLISLLGYHPHEDPGLSPQVQIENPLGILGVYTAHFLIKLTFGYASYLLPLVGVIWGWWFFSHREGAALSRLSGYLVGAGVLLSITTGLVELRRGTATGPHFDYSGLVGGMIARFLADFLGLIGVILVLVMLWLLLLRGYFAASFYRPFQGLREMVIKVLNTRRQRREQRRAEKEKRRHSQELRARIEAQQEAERQAQGISPPAPPEGVAAAEQEPSPAVEEDERHGKAVPREAPPGTGEEEEPVTLERETIQVDEMVVEAELDLDALSERQAPRRQYQMPPTDLLMVPPEVHEEQTREELVERANFLSQSLLTFGVEGKVVNVSPGPVITLFEVEPAEGVRVNKFVALADDLARVMEASRVRVIAPIPDKSSVGIEIPNRNPATVYFRSVINSEKFARSESKLTLAVGKTTSGEIATLDLDNMPHLLIAGTTGSGKSVCLNTIICSLLYRARPEEIKLVIIDPKKVEMSLYRALEGYHLLNIEDINEPIVTAPENAVYALRALGQEMNRRYDILADMVVRNIDEYNTKMKTQDGSIMPYIVLVIDELADLMMLYAKDVEAPIARLAQLSRAVGIHLVVATQRPSVDVITGVIKANFSSRIAFQVASKIDSRTIIDQSGAEKLIGRGDMLYLGSGTSEPVRLHNAYLSLDEIEVVMKHITDQPLAEELILPTAREAVPGELELGDDRDQDELFQDAVRLVVTHQQGSISLLQRRLKLGYSRAARLVDQMEQAGIVGPFTGSKAREVLVDESYLEDRDR